MPVACAKHATNGQDGTGRHQLQRIGALLGIRGAKLWVAASRTKRVACARRVTRGGDATVRSRSGHGPAPGIPRRDGCHPPARMFPGMIGRSDDTH